MTAVSLSSATRLAFAGVAIALVAGAGGFGLAQLQSRPAEPAAESGRKVLYWYDPMAPGRRFDRPGKSPYMDMDLVPKYADEAEAAAGGVHIDPAQAQSLGIRLATVERGVLPSGLRATGVLAYDERDVAIVQARAGGFVQRAYPRAPGDVIAAGAPLADVLVPAWAGAQGEYLAVRRTGDQALIAAARQRLRLLGMSESLIGSVERSGRVRNVVTISAPSSGVIKSLGVRRGMALAPGQTLAEINGLSRVWLIAAVPEVQSGALRPGLGVSATLAAYPKEVFTGQVGAILPEAQSQSRTVSARIELANPQGRLRPGMFATADIGAGVATSVLLVPSEALIRTGRRTLVMIAAGDGRFTPAEVTTGREAGGRAEILAGLTAGEQVVASGQFLIDSEASLSRLQPRPAEPAGPPAGVTGRLHRGEGRVEQVSPEAITLSHAPIPSLGWPAMTMRFPLAEPGLGAGVRVGDEVVFAFEQTRTGPLVRELGRRSAR